MPAIQRSKEIPEVSLKPGSPQAFFRQFSDFNLKTDADVKREFFRFCHSRGVQVGTPIWCHRWRECFDHPWDAAPFGDYSETGR